MANELPGTFTSVPNEALALPAPQVKVLLLVSCLTMDGKRAIKWSLVKEHSNRIGMSYRTIKDNIRLLVEGGHIDIINSEITLRLTVSDTKKRIGHDEKTYRGIRKNVSQRARDNTQIANGSDSRLTPDFSKKTCSKCQQTTDVLLGTSHQCPECYYGVAIK